MSLTSAFPRAYLHFDKYRRMAHGHQVRDLEPERACAGDAVRERAERGEIRLRQVDAGGPPRQFRDLRPRPRSCRPQPSRHPGRGRGRARRRAGPAQMRGGPGAGRGPHHLLLRQVGEVLDHRSQRHRLGGVPDPRREHGLRPQRRARHAARSGEGQGDGGGLLRPRGRGDAHADRSRLLRDVTAAAAKASARPAAAPAKPAPDPAGVAAVEPARLGLFERWLTLWVALCIVAGIVLGQVSPVMFHAIGDATVAQVNLPVAALVWLMIIPMLLKIDPAALREIGAHWRGIATTVGVNWLVKPFSMAFLGWLFVGHVFRPYLPAGQIDSYIAGLILLAAAP